jgi:uncharacterized membrane protein
MQTGYAGKTIDGADQPAAPQQPFYPQMSPQGAAPAYAPQNQPVYTGQPPQYVSAPPQQPAYVGLQPPPQGGAFGAPLALQAVGAAPVPPTPDRAALGQRLMTRRVNSNVCKYFGDAFNFVLRNFCTYLGVALVFIAFLVIQQVVLIFSGLEQERRQGEEIDWGKAIAARSVEAAFMLVLLEPIIYSGNYAVFQAMRRGNGLVSFGDFFFAFSPREFFRLLLLNLVLWAGVVIGFVLLWAPGILWLIFTVFARHFYVEHRFFGVCDAIGASFRMVSRYYCSVLGFLLLSFLILILGVLALVVGLFVVWPTVIVALCLMYAHYVGVNGCPLAPTIEEDEYAAAVARAQPVGIAMVAVPGPAQAYGAPGSYQPLPQPGQPQPVYDGQPNYAAYSAAQGTFAEPSKQKL